MDACLHWARFDNALLKRTKFDRSDLKYCSFVNADLFMVSFKDADLSGANFEYSTWPLWYGSFDAIADEHLVAQLAYHFCRLKFKNDDCKKAQNALKDLANKFAITQTSCEIID